MKPHNLWPLLVVGYLSTSPATAQDKPAAVALPSNPLTFVGIQPCRMADTRAGSGYPSGYGPPSLGAAVARNFALTGRCGIPASALAVSANVTVVGPAIAGFLGIAPQDGPAASVATLNYVAGQTVGNAAVIPLGTGGGARFISVAATDLVVDVNGYYTEQAPGPPVITINPLQIATLRWYQTARNGLSVPVGVSPAGAAFDGANIWVANGNGNSVTKVRAGDGAVLGTFAVGINPWAVAFDGLSVWVANNTSGTVTRLRASDGSFQGAFTTGSQPSGVAFDGASIWVSNQNSNNVTRLRASDGVSQGTFAVGTMPTGVAFDGANIWVANFGSGNVTKLRASDGAAQGTFPVGPNPVGLAFDGTSLWVTTYPGAVTRLSASDGAVLGTFTAAPGGGSLFAVFDGAFVWVVNSNANNLTRF